MRWRVEVERNGEWYLLTDSDEAKAIRITEDSISIAPNKKGGGVSSKDPMVYTETPGVVVIGTGE